MNIDDDYDNDGNNIVPCPICLDVYCPSKEDGKCPQEDEFAKHYLNTPDTEEKPWRCSECKAVIDVEDLLFKSKEHACTPDTEWTWKSEDKWHQTWHHKEHGDRQINKELLNFILTSRDTYWKERVEEIYSHFSWCQECAEGPMCKDALAIKDNLK